MYVLYSMYVPRLCRPVTETTKMRRHLIMSSDTPAVIGRSRAANNICTSEPSSPGHMRATSRRELGTRVDRVPFSEAEWRVLKFG